MFVVNAGSGFKWIWNSVKGFLDPKTSSKIHVSSSIYIPSLVLTCLVSQSLVFFFFLLRCSVRTTRVGFLK
jgi:hypothetical protein